MQDDEILQMTADQVLALLFNASAQAERLRLDAQRARSTRAADAMARYEAAEAESARLTALVEDRIRPQWDCDERMTFSAAVPWYWRR